MNCLIEYKVHSPASSKYHYQISSFDINMEYADKLHLTFNDIYADTIKSKFSVTKAEHDSIISQIKIKPNKRKTSTHIENNELILPKDMDATASIISNNNLSNSARVDTYGHESLEAFRYIHNMTYTDPVTTVSQVDVSLEFNSHNLIDSLIESFFGTIYTAFNNKAPHTINIIHLEGENQEGLINLLINKGILIPVKWVDYDNQELYKSFNSVQKHDMFPDKVVIFNPFVLSYSKLLDFKVAVNFDESKLTPVTTYAHTTTYYNNYNKLYPHNNVINELMNLRDFYINNPSLVMDMLNLIIDKIEKYVTNSIVLPKGSSRPLIASMNGYDINIKKLLNMDRHIICKDRYCCYMSDKDIKREMKQIPLLIGDLVKLNNYINDSKKKKTHRDDLLAQYTNILINRGIDAAKMTHKAWYMNDDINPTLSVSLRDVYKASSTKASEVVGYNVDDRIRCKLHLAKIIARNGAVTKESIDPDEPSNMKIEVRIRASGTNKTTYANMLKSDKITDPYTKILSTNKNTIESLNYISDLAVPYVNITDLTCYSIINDACEDSLVFTHLRQPANFNIMMHLMDKVRFTSPDISNRDAANNFLKLISENIISHIMIGYKEGIHQRNGGLLTMGEDVYNNIIYTNARRKRAILDKIMNFNYSNNINSNDGYNLIPLNDYVKKNLIKEDMYHKMWHEIIRDMYNTIKHTFDRFNIHVSGEKYFNRDINHVLKSFTKIVGHDQQGKNITEAEQAMYRNPLCIKSLNYKLPNST